MTDGDNVRGDYSRDKIEDWTGCIPLLLNGCIQNGEMRLDVAPIISVWNEVSSFVEEVRINSLLLGRVYHPPLNSKTLLTSIGIVIMLMLVLNMIEYHPSQTLHLLITGISTQ